jgi:hypothetical protein
LGTNFLQLFDPLQERPEMRDQDDRALSKRLRTVALAALAIGAVATSVADARPSTDLIVVVPTNLPEAARQPGDGMFLYEASTGRQLLYVEHSHGARLAIFDVTDPRHISAGGFVTVEAPEAFDVVSMLGNRAALVRFRESRGTAVLDLHDAMHPVLTTAANQSFEGSIKRLGNDGITVTRQEGAAPDVNAPAFTTAVVNTPQAPDGMHVVNVPRVRQEVTSDSTGTTFLLSDDGLYLIRRLSVERSNDFRAEGYVNTGG